MESREEAAAADLNTEEAVLKELNDAQLAVNEEAINDIDVLRDEGEMRGRGTSHTGRRFCSLRVHVHSEDLI